MLMVGTSSLPFMKAAVKLAPDCKVLRCGRGSHLWNLKSRRDKKPDLVVTKCLICYDFLKANQCNVACYSLGIPTGRYSAAAGWLPRAHNCLMNCNSEDC